MQGNGKGLLGRRLFTDTQQKSHCYPGREKVPPLETAELRSQSLVRGADLRPESVHSLFINKVLFELSHIRLAIIAGGGFTPWHQNWRAGIEFVGL